MNDRVRDYQAFVEAEARAATADGYLFDAPRCRFVPEPADELRAPAGAVVVRTAGGAAVQLPGGASLSIPGISFDRLRSAFARLPCTYSRLALELGPDVAKLMEQAFSRVLFAPAAVAELESAQPSLEIVRFPGSPYEIVRAYWQNSIAVRQRIVGRGLPESPEALRTLLLELHELLLLGEAREVGRRSFYLPASQLGRKRPTPGSFYEAPSVVERRGAETILVGGARVGVPLIGGARYWDLLSESVADPAALADERAFEYDGLALGRVVRARAEDEAVASSWFLPPRPLTARHFAALWQELRAAQAAEAGGDVPALLAALSSFHFHFVRIHPLPSGNQSLSMSFVNAALDRVLGIGIPHLLLDQLALRFGLAAYQRFFARAVKSYSAPWPDPSERLRYLVRLRNELNAFVTQLGSAASLLEARALVGSDPHGAALALLAGE